MIPDTALARHLVHHLTVADREHRALRAKCPRVVSYGNIEEVLEAQLESRRMPSYEADVEDVFELPR